METKGNQENDRKTTEAHGKKTETKGKTRKTIGNHRKAMKMYINKKTKRQPLKSTEPSEIEHKQWKLIIAIETNKNQTKTIETTKATETIRKDE